MMLTIQKCKFSFVKQVQFFADSTLEGILIYEVLFNLKRNWKVKAFTALKN